MRCGRCGEEITGEPVNAVQADVPARAYQDVEGAIVATPLHRECFESDQRVKVREWALPGQIGGREVIEHRNFDPSPFGSDGPGEDRVLVEWEVERWREVD